MKYELYIDVFFLVNFMMDYFVLLAAKKVLKCTATHKNILLGALLGSVGSCMIVCLPLPAIWKMICLHTLINTSMVIIGLKVQKLHFFLKGIILVYLISFLMGGIMTWLQQYLGEYFRIGSLFFFITISSYVLVMWTSKFLETLWKLNADRCEVTLYWHENSLKIQALIDSGNSLYDDISGKPVHIIGKKAIEKLTKDKKIQQVRYIPYRTIQEQESVLPIIVIDKMCIHGKEEKVIKSPLLGISGQFLFDNGNYEIILHPRDC